MFMPRREGFARPERAGRRREIGAAVEGVGPRPATVASGEVASGETRSTPSSPSSSPLLARVIACRHGWPWLGGLTMWYY